MRHCPYPPASPTFREAWRATPQPLSPKDEGHWLTSRYTTWHYTSFDSTLPPPDQTISQEISKTYEPDSVEISKVEVRAPAGIGAETDATSGFAHSTILSREKWGAISLRKESASDTARTTRWGYANGDPDRIFPSTFTNSMGQTTTLWPHATFGLPLAIDDPNGVRTTGNYDVVFVDWMWRVIRKVLRVRVGNSCKASLNVVASFCNHVRVFLRKVEQDDSMGIFIRRQSEFPPESSI